MTIVFRSGKENCVKVYLWADKVLSELADYALTKSSVKLSTGMSKNDLESSTASKILLGSYQLLLNGKGLTDFF
jgi:hypothetical protein